MNQKEKRNTLIKEIQEKQQALKVANSELHFENLKGDFSIEEDRNNFNSALDACKYTEAAQLALNIHHKIMSETIIDMDVDILAEIENYENTGAPQSFPPGFDLLEQVARGKKVMVGALPKVGKTTFACNLAHYNSRIDKKTLFLSYEMTPMEIWIKIFMLHMFQEHGKSLSFLPIDSAIRQRESSEQKKTYSFFYGFVEANCKNICVLDAATYTPIVVGIAIDKSINYFGDLPDWTILDYVQLIPDEPNYKGDMRGAMRYASKYITLKVKSTRNNLLGISQMNADGGYKESGAFEENSVMNIVLSKIMDGPDELDKLHIRIKSSRLTSAPFSVVSFDKKSGFIG